MQKAKFSFLFKFFPTFFIPTSTFPGFFCLIINISLIFFNRVSAAFQSFGREPYFLDFLRIWYSKSLFLNSSKGIRTATHVSFFVFVFCALYMVALNLKNFPPKPSYRPISSLGYLVIVHVKFFLFKKTGFLLSYGKIRRITSK